MHLRYEAVSICFAEFQNPTWNCRGICPLGWQSSMHHWRFVVKTGKFRIFHAVARTSPPLSFRSHRMKSLGRNSSTNTFHIFLPTHPPLPAFFISLGTTHSPNADIKFITLCNFYEGICSGFCRSFNSRSFSSFLNLGINLFFFVLFSFVLFMISLMVCNISLYFEISKKI